MSRKACSKSTKSSQVSAGQTNSIAETLIKTTTPKSHRKPTEADTNFYSPVFSQYSQDEHENVEVIWDWNASQIKTRPRKHKRIDFTQSPELSIKRHPSHNQIADFMKLEKELKMLKDDICSSKKVLHSVITKPVALEEAFNDSMEDQLLVCSQEVEKRANLSEIKSLNYECFSNILTPAAPISNESDLMFKPFNENKTEVTNIFTKLDDTLEKLANDTFDHLLQTMQDDDLKYSQLDANTVTNIPEKIHEEATTSIEEEIERKRQEALLKLESKKKHSPCENESPIKCSPEEIEQKRLQALAKLQAKKKQEIIERNRLEALKRLELNKKKRALQSDNTSIFYKLNI